MLQAESAFQGKIEASALPYCPAWNEKKENVMQQIILGKAKCCQKFYIKVMNTGIFAEAVPFLSFAVNWTEWRSDYGCEEKLMTCQNRMGKLLSTVKEAITDNNIDG